MNTTLSTLIKSLDSILMSTPGKSADNTEKRITIPAANVSSDIPLKPNSTVSIAFNPDGHYGISIPYMTAPQLDLNGKEASAWDTYNKCGISGGLSILFNNQFDDYKLAIQGTNIVLTALCKRGIHVGHILQWTLPKTA
jgi:hypothetical protein